MTRVTGTKVAFAAAVVAVGLSLAGGIGAAARFSSAATAPQTGAVGSAKDSRPALGPAPQADCTRVSTGFVPLSDLGKGTYAEFLGGLYPDGSNVPPPAHQAAAQRIAGEVTPLGLDGQPARDGRVVLLSLGMSNATQEFSEFIRLATADRTVNPTVLLVDGAQGGQTSTIIRNPDAEFWLRVDQRLQQSGSSPAQVQIAWVKEAVAGPRETFPRHAQSLADDLAEIARVAKARYPNLRIMYYSSRIYAGYASTNLNPEPYAYESGFAVRWAIERQIRGDPGLAFGLTGARAPAPLLLWGPYLWADGETPRSDGLVWTCDDFASDGTHPSSSGREKVARLLLGFFHTDVTSRSWFAQNAAPGRETPTPGRQVSPTPPSPIRTPVRTVTPGLGPGPEPTATPGEQRRIRVAEAGTGDRLWITTADVTLQRRLTALTEDQPAWLCGPVVAEPEAEWGFRLDPRRLGLLRSVDDQLRTTIRSVAASPARAAAAGHPWCFNIARTVEGEDIPPTPGETATAEPDVPVRIFVPFTVRRAD